MSDKTEDKTISDLKARNEELETQISDLKTNLKNAEQAKKDSEDEAVATISELSKKLEVAKTNKSGKPTVNHKGKSYVVVYPSVIIDGEKKSASEIAADKSLVEKLLEMESKALKLVNPKTNIHGKK